MCARGTLAHNTVQGLATLLFLIIFLFVEVCSTFKRASGREILNCLPAMVAVVASSLRACATQTADSPQPLAILACNSIYLTTVVLHTLDLLSKFSDQLNEFAHFRLFQDCRNLGIQAIDTLPWRGWTLYNRSTKPSQPIESHRVYGTRLRYSNRIIIAL